MNRKDHFEKYPNLQFDIDSDQLLSKKILLIQDSQIEDIIDTTRVRVIDYSHLKQFMSWPVILGKGVQGVVERMILEEPGSLPIDVAVKKITLKQ